MIKVTIADLLNSTDTLQKLSQKDFKAKLAWTIARLLKSAEKEIQQFNDTRMNLIKKYGEKDSDGELVTDDKGNCKIDRENLDSFNNELREVLEAEVELNANKIDMDLLGDVEFTPSDMAVLEPFVQFEDEQPADMDADL